MLVAKGLLTRSDVALALLRAEQTVLNDRRGDGLDPAQRDAVAFAPRLLQIANYSASDTDTLTFSELAKMVTQTRGLSQP